MGFLRRFDGFVAAILLLALGAVVVVLREDAVVGRARVVDGDTVAVSGRTIRLAGLDAPELAQTCGAGASTYRCGERAREALQRLVGSADLSCRVSGRDRYGRDLGSCSANGLDVGAALVAGGLAVAYGAYEGEERSARAAALGLWAGPFDRPADWRKAHLKAADVP